MAGCTRYKGTNVASFSHRNMKMMQRYQGSVPIISPPRRQSLFNPLFAGRSVLGSNQTYRGSVGVNWPQTLLVWLEQWDHEEELAWRIQEDSLLPAVSVLLAVNLVRGESCSVHFYKAGEHIQLVRPAIREWAPPSLLGRAILRGWGTYTNEPETWGKLEVGRRLD